MYDKIVKIIGYVVIGVSALVGILFFASDAGELETAVSAMSNLPADVKIMEVETLADNWGGLILNFSIYLFVGCAALAIGFAIFKFVTDAIESPKSAIKPAIAVGAAALLIIVSYSLASDAIPVFLGADNFDITPATSKWVETSLFAMYILFGVAIVTLVYTELSRIWR